ncbi:FHS family L-fucose permease-like MFS transporter [Ereboglobus sp. PH5-5]|uniref:L-fucose:H+ symporter permease n=1 Tax=Ereboglobus sp. PH5-5 TaxID=2940529 RepID=UPI002405C516|nr:L-fucose:H+ symporter permease [Ereboglobus sp. PH5-5]MDF9832346.1 FHS family L-fucose permease-like MFS transporter [Ereboglobus sp. PH5-5]
MPQPETPPHATRQPVIPPGMIVTFVLVTSLFALWGFANDITNPMVAAFKNVLLISNFQSAWVQAAFYGGYCFMAIPAALFIRRFSYKKGIVTGLFLYSAGCFLFVPAGNMMAFGAFLAAYFIMTCGLAFLETTANPYILSLGSEETATRRLNFAQAFNPIGSLTGMLVARNFILAKLDQTPEAGRRVLAETDPAAFAAMQKNDLGVIVGPYLMLGVVVLVVFVVFLLARLPEGVSHEPSGKNGEARSTALGATLRRLFTNPCYLLGVLAQAFYVGVQIMVWTFIIQYAENELGMRKDVAQGYNMVAMGIFVTSRFVCTYLLKYIRPAQLLLLLAIGGGVFTCGAIFIKGMTGLYCLVAVSACMSLMFPTIYGIALKGLGDDAKLASAGLIVAIGGGCVMPPLQGLIIDKGHWFGEALSSTRVSFVLPLLCFAAIAAYALFVKKHRPQ